MPADAEAKPGYMVRPASTELVLYAGKAGGHFISVIADGRQRVRLAIEWPIPIIEYSTKGYVTGRHIMADFGVLGRVDVRLRFARPASAPAHRGLCKGRGLHYAEGAYRGTIEFARGAAVPKVSVKRGRASFVRRFRRICKRPQPTPSLFPKLTRKLEEAILTVSGKSEGRTVLFSATIFASRRNPADSGGTISAVVYERSEGVRIARRTGRFFPHRSLVMSKRGREPETIDVTPPPPFAGHAFYSRNPDSPSSWTGDLRVDLPGAEKVPLAGPGFAPILCRGGIGSCLYDRSFTSSG